MLTYTPITADHRGIVIPMVERFYTTDAVSHPAPADTIARTFRDVADPAQPLLQGWLIYDGGTPVGYLYLTFCYSCEVGGLCLFLEELFIGGEYRGRGYGKQAMDWLVAQYPQCRRFRLEVTADNRAAVALYRKQGYEFLHYDQMVLDR